MLMRRAFRQRCRHAVAAVGSCLFLYGGLCGGALYNSCGPTMTLPSPGSLLDDLVVAEDARADDGMAGDTVEQLSAIADLSSPGWQVSNWGHSRSPSASNAACRSYLAPYRPGWLTQSPAKTKRTLQESLLLPAPPPRLAVLRPPSFRRSRHQVRTVRCVRMRCKLSRFV